MRRIGRSRRLCRFTRWWIPVQEFESATPYFYSTYGFENESVKSSKESVLVLGSGPIRIGQGVEFDYATVRSVKAIQALVTKRLSWTAIQTVSTDFLFLTSYFEPLTFEDVMNVIELEQPKGYRSVWRSDSHYLAEPLSKAGVKILGTQVADLISWGSGSLWASSEGVGYSAYQVRQPPRRGGSRGRS